MRRGDAAVEPCVSPMHTACTRWLWGLGADARAVQTVQTVTMCRVLALGNDDFLRLAELFPDCTRDLVSNLHAQAAATAALLARTSANLDSPLPPAAMAGSRSYSPPSHADGSHTSQAGHPAPPSSASSARTGFPSTAIADVPGSPALSASSKRGSLHSPRSCDVVAAAAAVARESHAGAMYRLGVEARPTSGRTAASEASIPPHDGLGVFMRTHSSNSGAGGSQHTSAEITAHMNGAQSQPLRTSSRPLSGMAVNSMDIYAAQWMPSPRIGGGGTGSDDGRPRSGPRSWFRGRSAKESAKESAAGGGQDAAADAGLQPGPVGEATGGSNAALLPSQIESLDDIFLSSYTPIVGAMDAAALVAEDETRDALRRAIKHLVRPSCIHTYIHAWPRRVGRGTCCARGGACKRWCWLQGLTGVQNPEDPLAITYLLQLLPQHPGARHRILTAPSLLHGTDEPPIAPTGTRAAWRACLPCLSRRLREERDKDPVFTSAMADLQPIKESSTAFQPPAHTAAVAAAVAAADAGLRAARTALQRQQHAEQGRCVAAAAAGDAAGVAQGFARGAAADREDSAGRTPTGAAASLGHINVLKKILSYVDEQGMPTTDLAKCAAHPQHRLIVAPLAEQQPPTGDVVAWQPWPRARPADQAAWHAATRPGALHDRAVTASATQVQPHACMRACRLCAPGAPACRAMPAVQ